MGDFLLGLAICIFALSTFMFGFEVGRLNHVKIKEFNKIKYCMWENKEYTLTPVDTVKTK